MVGEDRAGHGVSASNSGLRWGVQAGMQGAEAVRACAHSWRSESRAPTPTSCGLNPRVSQSLPPCAWQQPLPARHEGQEGQRQEEVLQPRPEACEFKPDADVLKQLELPDVAAALQQAGLSEQLLTAAGLSSDMVR